MSFLWIGTNIRPACRVSWSMEWPAVRNASRADVVGWSTEVVQAVAGEIPDVGSGAAERGDVGDAEVGRIRLVAGPPAEDGVGGSERAEVRVEGGFPAM